ncbi:MAG: hypothetical protein V7K69_13080 [Nostoc sp.]|uniref:hypothetical protein n=1 Tax=Nostoc sp. TaxID=1180 RepID=UPI002FF94FE5
MKYSTFFLLLYAEVSSLKEAEELLQAITPQIQAHTLFEVQDISQYYKISEYYGINLDLYPRSDPLTTFDGLVLCGASGWTFTTEHDGVWNPQPGVVFLSPLVRWANLVLWM